MSTPARSKKTLVVGLTGGIASGKSLASDAFEQLGVPVIDTDRIARELVEPGKPALDAIIQAFGRSCLDGDGALDRAALRRQVFSDGSARARLEAILHPRIRRCVAERISAVTSPYCIVVVPLLVESDMTDMVDRVLVVDVAAETQIARLMARDAIPEPLARRMLAAQADRAARLAVADDVIDNSGVADSVEEAVAMLDARYRRD